MGVSERVAYLRGLAEGMGLFSDKKEGKFYEELLNCLEELSGEVEFIAEDQADLEDYVDEMDEALSEVEDIIFDEEEEDDDFEDYEFDPLDKYIETNCPECDETVGYFDETYDQEGPIDIICPNCDAVVAVVGDDEELDEEKEK